MWITFTAFLCSVAFCTATRQEYGLCSQVYLMSQYCSNNDVTPTNDVIAARGPIGKSGPAGLKGEKGEPGIANYAIVKEEMNVKIREIEQKFESNIEENEIIMNKTVSKLDRKIENLNLKLAEYETSMNETLLELEREVEKKFVSKFKEYETIMNKTLSRLEKAESMLPIVDCHKEKLENAKVKTETGGVFNIYPAGAEVFCDLTTDGGGWTVFQRRLDGSQSFSQDWSNYVAGFGDLTGEFWLGLEKLHLLTRDGEYELRVELTDKNGKIGIATYQTFSISGSSENYKLNVGGFSGTGLIDKLSWHNSMAFSTKDRDNDKYSGNCAVIHGETGWWFNACYASMLNKTYGSIVWYGFSSIKKTEMKFRKK